MNTLFEGFKQHLMKAMTQKHNIRHLHDSNICVLCEFFLEFVMKMKTSLCLGDSIFIFL